jgi:hypothetical protein
VVVSERTGRSSRQSVCLCVVRGVACTRVFYLCMDGVGGRLKARMRPLQQQQQQQETKQNKKKSNESSSRTEHHQRRWAHTHCQS